MKREPRLYRRGSRSLFYSAPSHSTAAPALSEAGTSINRWLDDPRNRRESHTMTSAGAVPIAASRASGRLSYSAPTTTPNAGKRRTGTCLLYTSSLSQAATAGATVPASGGYSAENGVRQKCRLQKGGNQIQSEGDVQDAAAFTGAENRQC